MKYIDTDTQSITSSTSIRCSYCNHDLSNANPITYVQNQPVCKMCLSHIEVEGQKKCRVIDGTLYEILPGSPPQIREDRYKGIIQEAWNLIVSYEQGWNIKEKLQDLKKELQKLKSL